jgi:hypothetical protein
MTAHKAAGDGDAQYFLTIAITHVTSTCFIYYRNHYHCGFSNTWCLCGLTWLLFWQLVQFYTVWFSWRDIIEFFIIINIIIMTHEVQFFSHSREIALSVAVDSAPNNRICSRSASLVFQMFFFSFCLFLIDCSKYTTPWLSLHLQELFIFFSTC